MVGSKTKIIDVMHLNDFLSWCVEAKEALSIFQPYGKLWRARHRLYDHGSEDVFNHILLDAEYWLALEVISKREGISRDQLIYDISSSKKTNVEISGAIKIFVLSYFLMCSVCHQEIICAVDEMHKSQVRRKMSVFGVGSSLEIFES